MNAEPTIPLPPTIALLYTNVLEVVLILVMPLEL